MFGRSSTDDLFFEDFIRHAKSTLEGATLLVALFDELANVKDLARAISEAEHVGDTLTHGIVKRLHETWITPFDRGDILTLISRMDDVLDLIEAASDRVSLFEITESRAGAKEISQVLVKCCEQILRAVELLPNGKRRSELLDIAAQIGVFESEADTIYRRAIAQLFKPGNDPIEVMKWREVYDSLETACDRCADVANVIEGVVLEYA